MEDSASSSSDAVPRPSQYSYTHPQKIFYSITYALPGQIAYCIPRMSEDPKYRQRLLELLKAQSGISYQEINAATGSLVVAYEPGLMSDTLREHLANLFQRAELTNDTEVIPVPSTSKAIALPAAPEYITDSAPIEQPVEVDLANLFQSDEVTGDTEVIPVPTTSQPLTDAAAIEPAPEYITDAVPTGQPVEVACSVVHSIPGRVRFHVPQIATDPAYVQRLEALLQSDPIVISQRINRKAASVIITYQPAQVPRSKDTLQSVFAIAVKHFSSLIESALTTANTSSSK